ncbi:hypothetical protein SYNPS1DRAFT_25770, partial [Syncephalis pseudoplumigaleata]
MEQVEKFVPLMMKCANQLDYAQKLLVFLDMTESSALLRKFMNTHGLQVLKLYLVEYHHKNDELCRLILGIMDRLPITIRNAINACRVDEVVEKFTTHEDSSIASLATKLIDDWKELKVVYKIPKRSKPPSRATESTAPAPDRPSHNESTRRSSSPASYSPPSSAYNYADRHYDRSPVDDADYEASSRSTPSHHYHGHGSPYTSHHPRNYPSPHYGYGSRYSSKASGTSVNYAAAAAAAEFDEASLPREPLAMRQLSQPARTGHMPPASSNTPSRNHSAPSSPSQAMPATPYRPGMSGTVPHAADGSPARNVPMAMMRDDQDMRDYPSARGYGAREMSHHGGQPSVPGSSPMSSRYYAGHTGRAGLDQASSPGMATLVGGDSNGHSSNDTSTTYTPNTPNASTDTMGGHPSTTTATATAAQATEPLPPHWKSAMSSDGIYYYHTITGKTQWSRPEWETEEGKEAEER